MKFRIIYTDPETQEKKVEICECEDTEASVDPINGFKIGRISAKEWAEDYAYSLSDKGDYTVEEE